SGGQYTIILAEIKPSLTFLSITPSDSSPDSGDTITLTVNTRNDGGAGSLDIGLSVFDPSGDECGLQWKENMFYSSGESKTHTFSYLVPAEIGSYQVISKSWDNCSGYCGIDQCCDSGTSSCTGPQTELDIADVFSVSKMFPVASFTYSIDGLTASFTSTSYDPNGHSLQSYQWDFGDDKTSSEENPVHTYSASADYKVTLTVTDNKGHKSTRSETISVGDDTIAKVIHPDEIPHGTELIVKVETKFETDITLDIDTFHQTKHGTDITFSIDTATLSKDEHTLTVTAESDEYVGSIIIYDAKIYQAITKGLDDLETCSKDEMREISGITGHTLTNHVYTILLGIEIGDNVTAGDVLNNLQGKLEYASDKVSTELESFKNILITLDSSTTDDFSGMDSAINSITNIKNAINVVNNQVSDENIVGSINKYVTKPAVYNVICSDEVSTIETRTWTKKSSLDSYYTQNQLDEFKEILLIGKEAINNTAGEQIYRLDIGTVLGQEISAKPTLKYLAEKQTQSLNPPPDVCALGYCIPGKYNPVWVYHMTVADAESILTIPAYLGWIDATPEDENIQPSLVVTFEPVTMTIQAARAYMKYVDMIEKFSPWLIDGGMIISTDLLAKEVNEEHADVIEAVNTIVHLSSTTSVEIPTITNTGLYVPQGNILVRTSPDGKIRNFKYIKSNSMVSKPKHGKLISLNTGWSQTFDTEQQNVWLSIKANDTSFNVNDTVNLTIDITSDAYLEEAMIWIFIPEANTTIKDIVNITIGDMSKNYNFTIINNLWHVPRVYLTDFGTMLAENHTSFSVGTQDHESGLITIDQNEFYSPGIVAINVTIHNTGNSELNSKLEYYGTYPNLTGSINIQTLQVGQQTTEQLIFNLTTPEIYDIYFILNSIGGALDYNTAHFTVTAIDTLLAFPSTDKP
ncbi:MAG: PKD domain-containing protein, partial [Candidatus Pacebacteria bacterium]|nr:PKD domain-containing protein [Candidatus Paceibacterota bacterium]